ncbi:envelope stress response membrane protein PspC [Providencia vermicola]|uniref:Envelope stress response membrane protein PspC n=2 Tax=Providencia TaxID=586 RepID=A0AAI9I333_PROST|nr:MULTISPECIES: envelope stress response membrane protein PspC [Providencia]ELR5045524.1 envelope stress response membrane protein PspC [Providencia rettgeri]ELR5037398.1 envelope stress response membrane protein PspC [Providencia stuartii]ELR5120175.1 envelope stress response membrane protein PspC [Providencia stuartii]ELR5143538.1 envelope stress response membrane protein PspC [Providencia stuartii]ELR5292223.1 envelope stress response membrane protein PspC [Providencia stuartii]
MTDFRNRKLYRLTDRRVFGGVCSGIAQFLDLPVALVRALAVLALFMSFGITLILYIVMCFVVPKAPSGYQSEQDISVEVTNLFNEVDAQLKSGEQRLRQIERYVTSDTYTVNSKFRHL